MGAESQYNYRFRGLDGTDYVLNGLSGTIIADPKVGLESSTFSLSEHEFLRAHHFVGQSEQEQRDLLLQRNHRENRRGDRLELTLMLHEDCNFRCTYCFEDFVNRKLEGDRISDLLRFVDQKLLDGGKLLVHYYGGEPLLAWDSLVQITERLEGLAAGKTGTFGFFITTNGSLLNEERISYLVQHGALHAKITLDGPAEVHDKRRVKVNGSGTFERILHNLALASARLPVILRVNIDATNLPHVPQLLDLVGAACGEGIRNISVDYNAVYDRETGGLKEAVGYPELHRIQMETLDRGFRLHLPPLLRTRYCKFNSTNSFLMDTEGSLFLCSKGEAYRVGSTSAQATPRRLPIITGSSGAGPEQRFQQPKEHCPSCHLLPICGGGCTLLADSGDDLPCPSWKDHVEDYLRLQCRVMDLDSPMGGTA